MIDKGWLITLALTSLLPLAGCMDAENNSLADNNRQLQTQILSQDDASTPPIASAEAEGIDLTITSVEVAGSNADHWTFSIDVANLQDGDYSRDDLSFMLELSQQADFAISYRSALFDQQTDGDTVGARTKTPALPTGTYFARIEVNPDWSMYLENNFYNHNIAQALRYVSEADSTNNYSTAFNLTVSSPTQCTEDTHESSNNLLNPTPLESGSSVTASLCLDNSDYYAMQLQQGATTVLTFNYQDDTAATRYVIVTPDFYLSQHGSIESNTKDIQFTAEQTGVYYLALYGSRASYGLSRDIKATQNADWFFSDDSVAGPLSPVLGQITLHRLQFTEAGLIGKTISCGRYVLDPDNGDEYITPSHFPDIHTYHFSANGVYERDGERGYNWSAKGDISTVDWYENLYFGWAENTGDGGFRYWDFEGTSYVECQLK